MSWIWWNTITGRIARPTIAAGNRMFAIGTPVASDFFEPQNTTTISSAFGKPSARLEKRVAINTIASNTTLTSRMRNSSIGFRADHAPVIIAALNAAYTTSRIEPRSVQLSTFEFRFAHG